MSLPVWEEWIEIGAVGRSNEKGRSLPVWEEWIEIASKITGSNTVMVSSRMGRVD